MSSSSHPAGGPAAGWYDDPEGSDAMRWWDGEAWTTRIRPNQAPPPSAEVGSWILPASAALPEAASAVPAPKPEPPAPPQPQDRDQPSAHSDPDEEAKARLAAAYYKLRRRRTGPRSARVSPFLIFGADAYLWYRAQLWLEEWRNIRKI